MADVFNGGQALTQDQINSAQQWSQGKTAGEIAAKAGELGLTAAQVGSVFGDTSGGANVSAMGYGTSGGLNSNVSGYTYGGASGWAAPAAPAPATPTNTYGTTPSTSIQPGKIADQGTDYWGSLDNGQQDAWLKDWFGKNQGAIFSVGNGKYQLQDNIAKYAQQLGVTNAQLERALGIGAGNLQGLSASQYVDNNSGLTAHDQNQIRKAMIEKGWGAYDAEGNFKLTTNDPAALNAMAALANQYMTTQQKAGLTAQKIGAAGHFDLSSLYDPNNRALSYTANSTNPLFQLKPQTRQGQPEGLISGAIQGAREGKVDFDTETVEGRIKNLIDPENPLNQRIRTNVLQNANARGLANSSIAEGDAMSAIIANAQGIAAQDAAAYRNQSLTNDQVVNQFRRDQNSELYQQANMVLSQYLGKDTMAQQQQYDMEKLQAQLANWQTQFSAADQADLRTKYIASVTTTNQNYQTMILQIQNSTMSPDQKTQAIGYATQLRDNQIDMWDAAYSNMPGWSKSWSLKAPSYTSGG